MSSKLIIFGIYGVLVVFIWNVATDVFDKAPEEDCKFCAFVNNTKLIRKLYDSEELVAFKSDNPTCPQHFLVIPKKHIKNYYSPEVTCELVFNMSKACEELLTEVGQGLNWEVRFHNPPFYSVKHLHMHCMGCSSGLSLNSYINAWHSFAAPTLNQSCLAEPFK